MRPPLTVVYDDDDPYLVVAADKGTAGWSDRANDVAAEYGYWLGEAFATGGSHGYHHKQLGITARGAFVCMRRHFLELGLDIDKETFSVVGVGSMDGDVFGNGMLLSNNIRLLGAFSADYIFLDPTPDRQASFNERKRLFNLQGSSWKDYDPALISPGGGVFPRNAKNIPLSPEVRAWLGVRYSSIDGEGLMRLLLTAPVDLLWLGGIGTYVKASSEINAKVGDRANDGARVDASQLRAKVVGEGANLGFTQKARIEYALNGGRINTDAVDNSAGVDLSDHEVNLKILMATPPRHSGFFAPKDADRNRFLAELTDDVCRSVLADNYRQSLCLSLENKRCHADIEPFMELADQLEHAGMFDRGAETFPIRKEMLASTGKGLTRPELAMLMAHTKLALKRALLEASDFLAGQWVEDLFAAYFPARARDRYAARLKDHALGREIAATMICNKVIDQAGAGFLVGTEEWDVARLIETVRAYITFDLILEGDRWREAVHALDGKTPTSRQYKLLLQLEELSVVPYAMGVGQRSAIFARARSRWRMAKLLAAVSRSSGKKRRIRRIEFHGAGRFPHGVSRKATRLSHPCGFIPAVARKAGARIATVRRGHRTSGVASNCDANGRGEAARSLGETSARHPRGPSSFCAGSPLSDDALNRSARTSGIFPPAWDALASGEFSAPAPGIAGSSSGRACALCRRHR